MSTEARSRGGQPGNSNASYYHRAGLNARTAALLAAARDGATLDDDIDLLRAEMARLVKVGDYDPRALAAIARAVVSAELARHKIHGGAERDAAMAALDTTLADLNRLYDNRLEQETAKEP